MRSFSHKLCVAFWVILALLIFVPFTFIPIGRALAQCDVWRGHYEYKTGGLSRGTFPTANRLLRERYGVVLSSSRGCMKLPHQACFMFGYDSVSKPAIQKQFGKDVIAECENEAREELRKKYGD
jgi:hypothetical protein